MIPLLVLDDHTMQTTLLLNQQIVNEFPFFKQAHEAVKAVGSCAPCQRGAKGQVAREQVALAKKMIGELPPDRKQRLKELLRATRVRVYWSDAASQRQRADF